MTLEQLRYFLSAARSLSFARAAEEHFVHQSAVGKSVAKLEEEFGLRLFERGNRRLELTEAGRLLCRQAEELLAHSDTVREAMRSYAAGVTGTLRLTATNVHFMYLMDRYSDFCREHPGIRWEFPPCTEDLAQEPLEQVLQGETDFGIVSAGPEPVPDLGQLRLCRERICLILPSEHPMAQEGSLPLEALERLDIVDSARWRGFPLAGLDTAFRQRTGRDLHPLEPGRLLHPGKELLSYLRANHCATPVPYSLAAHSGRDYTLLELPDYEPDYAVWLIWRRDNLNPALTLFLRAMRDYVPPEE